MGDSTGLNRYRFTASKDDQSLSFGGYPGRLDESFILDMMAAMREGLEANGFTVEVSLVMGTEMTL